MDLYDVQVWLEGGEDGASRDDVAQLLYDLIWRIAKDQDRE